MLSDEEMRKRFNALLLNEIQNGEEQLFFISQAVAGKPDEARGVFVYARGPVQANSLVHQLGLYVKDSESMMTPVDDDLTLQPTQIGVLLTKTECEAIFSA